MGQAQTQARMKWPMPAAFTEVTLVKEIKSIKIVHASWCPHCHPTTVEPMEEFSKRRGIPISTYDIDDPDQVKQADNLVMNFGDRSEDYLIPQIFLEFKDGGIVHVLTGYSESVELTKRAVMNLMNSPYFRGDSSAE